MNKSLFDCYLANGIYSVKALYQSVNGGMYATPAKLTVLGGYRQLRPHRRYAGMALVGWRL